MAAEGELVCLIKPQFEAGREMVGKKGVVRDKKVHLEVIHMVSNYASEIGFDCLDLSFSPITGPEGNIEYLLYLKKLGSEDRGNNRLGEDMIQALVESAHQELKT